MTLTKNEYRPRIIDEKLGTYLSVFGAVVLEGPKWCGKTWTALNRANSAIYVMDPSGGYSIRETAMMNPTSVLGGTPPALIDEWQEVPSIWDAVRHDVDAAQRKGLYILTGSTKPVANRPRHSGVGRIARLRMRTMSLHESGDSTGAVSLRALLGGEKIDAFSQPMDIENLIALARRGGWPENVTAHGRNAGLMPAQYIEQITESELSSTDDGVRRDPDKVRLLIRSLSRNIATIVSNTTLQKDILNGAVSFSMPTLTSYMEALKTLFVLDEIPGWAPAMRARIRVQSSPKRIFADPSLAVAGLRASPERLLKDLPAFGNIFENLCYRDLCVYADAVDAKVFHYRDDSDLEVDAIIESDDDRYGAFEIKLNPERMYEGVRTLLRFREKMTSRGNAKPACLVVLTGGGSCYTREDGVSVVPITALKE